VDFRKVSVKATAEDEKKSCLADRSIYFGLPPQDGNFSTTFPDS
jgi:hypothetical protein